MHEMMAIFNFYYRQLWFKDAPHTAAKNKI